MIRCIRFRIVLCVWLIAVTSRTFAAESCPLIRPPGLSQDAVDALVLRRAGEALGIESNKLDRTRTINALGGRDNAALHYAYFVVAVGESLGFDAAAAFYQKAKARGSERPWDSLTLDEFQVISREKYREGTDAPLPKVKPNTEYDVGHIWVRVPSQFGEWSLLQCRTGQIVFQSQRGARELTTAEAGWLDLPPFESNAKFSDYTRAVVMTHLSSIGTVKSLQITPVANSAAPCVLVEASAEREASPYLLYARFCYRDGRSGRAYSAMFSHFGAMPKEPIRAEALAFFDGTFPK
jgi:hypothetical protein